MLDIIQVVEKDEVVQFFAKGHHSWEDMLAGIEHRGWGEFIDDRLAESSQERMRFIPNPPRFAYYAKGRGSFPCTIVRLHKRTVLIIIQYEDDWDRSEGNYYAWLRGFWASIVGNHLKEMLPVCDAEICCASLLTTDFITKEINRWKPDIILTYGQDAQRKAEEMCLDFIPLSLSVREELQRRIRCLSQRTNVSTALNTSKTKKEQN